ncbi:MAG: hypothetical protein HY758_03000 [Nitrospirae bacterium]|nr:hypothetical protein [Nitrospirota bacterium]
MLQLRFISAILIMCIISISGNNALSWEDGTTHKSLAQYASENSVLSKTKGDYLKILGFNKGLKEELKWNDTINITQWLQAGAGLEDTSGPYSIGYIDGKGRSFNHFLKRRMNQAGRHILREPSGGLAIRCTLCRIQQCLIM